MSVGHPAPPSPGGPRTPAAQPSRVGAHRAPPSSASVPPGPPRDEDWRVVLTWSGRAWQWMRARPLASAGGAIIAVQVLIYAIAAWRSYYILDDYVFMTRAARPGLVSSLFSGYNGHVMPGGFLVTWVLVHVSPMNWHLTAAAMTLGLLAVDLAVFAMLRELFGQDRRVLLLLTLAIASPITVSANIWYAAALNQMPFEIAMPLAVRAHVRYLRGGQRRDSYRTIGWVLFGLAFYEKSILIVLLLAALTFLYYSDGTPWKRIGRSLMVAGRTWIGLAAVSAAYLTFYSVHIDNSLSGAGNSEQRLSVLHNLIWNTYLPGAVGGPWRFTPAGVVTSLATPPPLVAHVGALAFLAVALVGLLLRWAAWRAWVLLVVWVSVDSGLIVHERINATFGLELRDLTDTAFVTTLCVGLAFLGLPGSRDPGTVPLLHIPATMAAPFLRGVRTCRDRILGNARTVIAASMGVFLTGVLLSDQSMLSIWQFNPGKVYLPRLVADMDSLPRGAVVANMTVPDIAVWHGMAPSPHGPPEALLSNTLRPLRKQLDYRLTVTDAYYGITPAGQFQLDPFITGPDMEPGTSQCGWAIQAAPVTIPLTGHTTIVGDWVLRLGYLASQTTRANVTAGSTTRAVTFKSGPNTVWLQVHGKIGQVQVSGLADGGTVCVGAATVGYVAGLA